MHVRRRHGAAVACLLAMSCAASAYDVSRALPRSALGATRMRWLVASSSRHHGSDTSFGVKMTTPGGRDAKVASIQIDYLPANLSYVPEREMYTLFCAAAQKSGHDELTAGVLTRCAVNMYSLGCGYHPSVVKRVLDVLEAPVVANERWAVVLSKVINRELPKLRGTCLPIVSMNEPLPSS